MEFEEQWQTEEERVTSLLKEAGRYVSTLKAWKKACTTGDFNGRQKAATQAAQLAPGLAGPVTEALSAWNFDVREYLGGTQWRRDVITAAASDKFDLRVTEEGETLISSPVIVRAQAGRGILQIGRQSWPHLRPRAVAAELKRLRDRMGASNSAEFLESLYAVWNRMKTPTTIHLRFKEIYDLFSLTPGWKRDNPLSKFAQDVYALHRSPISFTRSGTKYEFVMPSANVKEPEILTVIAEDGRPIRYHGIRFADEMAKKPTS